jgi:uncharacterized protein YlxW (UPF0749 family)
MEETKSTLEDRLAGLREELSGLEGEAAEDAGMRDSFSEELESVRALAGLTQLRGPGVEVVLDDASQVPSGVDPNACLIHDYDLAATVNALLVGGAEAVSINDERILPITAVRCAGNTILVNSTRVGAPYTVRAIGDPEELESALREDEAAGPVLESYPQAYGLQAKVERRDEMVLPAYRGRLRAEYAAPLGGGEGG